MKYRLRLWMLLLLLVALCAGGLAGVAWWRARRSSNINLMARLPADGAIVLSVDFAALRRAGLLKLLAGSPVGQEPEYRSFVDETGFDYLHDLDQVAVSFHRTGTYFLLQGRFDWRALKDYATQQGGRCYNLYCWMPGSTEERRISFCPLRPDVMALAVSRDTEAARILSSAARQPRQPAPPDPLWLRVPVAVLRNQSRLPAGTRMFASALHGADSLLLALGWDTAGMRLRADITCQSAAGAAALAAQLTAVTVRLRGLIARENQSPNPADLSGVLAGGTFSPQATHVLARWPVDRRFLNSLAGGNL